MDKYLKKIKELDYKPTNVNVVREKKMIEPGNLFKVFYSEEFSRIFPPSLNK